MQVIPHSSAGSPAALTCGVFEIPEQKSANYIMEFFHTKCLMKLGLTPFLLCVGFEKHIDRFVAGLLLKGYANVYHPMALL